MAVEENISMDDVSSSCLICHKMSEYEYPLSTGRSNILGTEAFRNLLGQSSRIKQRAKL